MSHSANHEQILAHVLGGELARNAPEAASLLRDCASCRVELARLSDIASRLDTAGALVRADLDPGPALGDALDVGAILEGAWSAAPSGASGSAARRRLFIWITALAAIIAVLLLLRGLGG